MMRRGKSTEMEKRLIEVLDDRLKDVAESQRELARALGKLEGRLE